MIRFARCCCGACELEVDDEPTLNAVCHCNSCKKRTGSAFGWSAYFPDERVLARRGEMKAYVVKGDVPVRRWFCAVCGSTVFWEGGGFMPGQTGFAGGCSADTPLPEPAFSANPAGRC